MDATLKTQAKQLARDLATQVSILEDLNGLLRGMMKTALERMLNTELDVHLGRRPLPGTTDAGVPTADITVTSDLAASPAPKNRRNGHSQKTVRARFSPA